MIKEKQKKKQSRTHKQPSSPEQAAFKLKRNKKGQGSGIPAFQTYSSWPSLCRSNPHPLESQKNLPHPSTVIPFFCLLVQRRDAQSGQIFSISSSIEYNP